MSKLGSLLKRKGNTEMMASKVLEGARANGAEWFYTLRRSSEDLDGPV